MICSEIPANLAKPRPLRTETASSASAGPAARPDLAGSLPRWRAILEARWQARLQQVIELSLAFHDAAAVAGIGGAGSNQTAGAAQRRLTELMRRTVAARRALADVEEALARLAAGRFGRCEQCAATIPPATLAHIPEARYCPRCSAATVDRAAAPS